MKTVFIYLFGAIVFLIAVILTDAVFWADSADYVDSVVAFQQGKNYSFWEFGHLFWRPSGWLVWSQILPSATSDYWRSQINSVFQWFSYAAGLGSVLVLAAILKNLKLPERIIAVIIACFIFSHAFLNFTQTGTSYVAALLFYLLALFFSLRETEEKTFLDSILSGICLALTLCFWMPFLWTIPAVIVAPLIIYEFNKRRLTGTAIKLVAFASAVALFYGIVSAILRIDSASEIKSWITAASHGNETRGVLRMFFGLARSFVNMGSDGILLKRFLLNDPYNPVSFGVLISESLWKLACFYGLVAGTLFLLWNAKNRKFLALLLTATVPMLSFAALFDGGAVERYLPLFPVALVSLAIALHTEEWKFLRYAMLIVLALFALININALSVWRVSEQQNKLASRVVSLETKAQPMDKIFVVNWTDDLINFNRSFPFNPTNLRGNLRWNAVVTPGSAQTKQWREEFAARSLTAWENGQNVWLSNRASSPQPKSDWNWTEGDDKNVNWKEFPEFFEKVEFGESTGDENGFSLMLPSETNKSYLREFKNKFAGKIEL